jgi:adenylyl- and sulfurtransferase ThiI
MASAHIVVHYHELWLKKGNRNFFLHQLRDALRRALEGIAVVGWWSNWPTEQGWKRR